MYSYRLYFYAHNSLLTSFVANSVAHSFTQEYLSIQSIDQISQSVVHLSFDSFIHQ